MFIRIYPFLSFIIESVQQAFFFYLSNEIYSSQICDLISGAYTIIIFIYFF